MSLQEFPELASLRPLPDPEVLRQQLRDQDRRGMAELARRTNIFNTARSKQVGSALILQGGGG